MRNAILIIFFFQLAFGQLAAQTFEKRIQLNSSSYYINDVLVSQKQDLELLTTNYLPRTDSLRSNIQSLYLKLDSLGSIKVNKKFESSELDSVMIDSLNHLDVQLMYHRNNKVYFHGRLRTHIPNGFSFVKFLLIDDEDAQLVKKYSEIKDTSKYLYSSFTSSGSDYNTGVVQPNSAAYGLGYLQIINDSLQMREKVMFDDQAGYWLDFITDLLVDNRGNIFTFSGGYSPPPFYLGQGLQIHKLGPDLNLIKKENCSIPARNNYENRILFNGDYNSVWLSDSSFLVATAVPNNFDTAKGDVHLMVYDTALNRLSYKRIVTADTNLKSLTNSLVYDSVSHSIYFGVTQGLHEFTNGNPFREILPTSFRLFKMDKDLNIIWDRSYYNEATIRLEHVVSDQRGNITMAGTYEDSSTRANNYERHLYILRVDSLGNFNPIGIADQKKIPSRDYLFYPNPMDDRLLARRFNHQKDYQLRFYDSGGKLIEQLLWKEDQLKVNTSNWPKGVIIYQLEDEQGRRASGKLIKQ